MRKHFYYFYTLLAWIITLITLFFCDNLLAYTIIYIPIPLLFQIINIIRKDDVSEMITLIMLFFTKIILPIVYFVVFFPTFLSSEIMPSIASVITLCILILSRVDYKDKIFNKNHEVQKDFLRKRFPYIYQILMWGMTLIYLLLCCYNDRFNLSFLIILCPVYILIPLVFQLIHIKKKDDISEIALLISFIAIHIAFSVFILQVPHQVLFKNITKPVIYFILMMVIGIIAIVDKKSISVSTNK